MNFFQLEKKGIDIENVIYIRDRLGMRHKIITVHKPKQPTEENKYASLQLDVTFPDTGISIFFFNNDLKILPHYYIEALKTPIEIQKFFHRIVRKKNISLSDFLIRTIEVYLENQQAKLLVTKREPDFSLEKILVSNKTF